MVDGYMQPLLRDKHAHGAIVGVSVHGKRSFFAYSNATDASTPFTPTTLVEIGSCTKVFTTTLFTLAIARHQMDPNASAQKYMPSGYTLQPPAQKVTPLELADFSSGIPREPDDLPPGIQGRRIEVYTAKDFLHWASQWKPEGPLPAPYLYSNAGIGLLSFMITTATGKPWDEQVHHEIIDPLGMTDTELRPNPEQKRRTATGHSGNGTEAPVWPVPAWFAAGSLRSTALDMLRFGEANLGHHEVDGKVVPDELIAAMKAAQAPIYTMPSGKAKLGMTWVNNLGVDAPGASVEILKNGGTSGFSTVILLNPDQDIAVFIAVDQEGGDPSPVALEIGRHIPHSASTSGLLSGNPSSP
jgi:CubicO group peptidase (beta-lactamase class C family)